MSAYLICRVRVSDPDVYAKYAAKTPAIIARHGGRYIIRGGATENLEGEHFDGRFVVVEFPSADAARNFYNSPEYQAVRQMRLGASEADFMIAPGV